MNENLNKISVVGSGNVASQLIPALHRSIVEITHLHSRNKSSALDLLSFTSATRVCSLDELPKDQLVLLCVPDDQIIPILNRLDPEMRVAYTSGNLHLEKVDSARNVGVFYPLQTFSKGRPIELEAVPFLVEANNDNLLEDLLTLAHRISRHVTIMTSEERQLVHQVAVWVNNFTNHILYHAKDLAEENKLNFSLFDPLLKETIAKLETLSPEIAQTGPARRGDRTTIQSHLNQLSGTRKELYALLSRSIEETSKNTSSRKHD